MIDILLKPAFYMHILSALFTLAAIVIFIVNYKKILRLESFELIEIFSLLAIAIAAHGKSHILLEQQYGYDPISYLY
jgi:hypothetical protein